MVILVAGLLITAPVSSAREFDPEFGLYQRDSSLIGWADLSSLITEGWIDNMKDGLQYRIDCRFLLRRPRRIWGHTIVAQGSISVRVAYNNITSRFLVSADSTSLPGPATSLTQADLHLWLADSVSCLIDSDDKLDPERQYELKLDLEIVRGLLSEMVGTPDGGESPIKLLFRGFVELTGLGRDDYSFKSVLFRLSELQVR